VGVVLVSVAEASGVAEESLPPLPLSGEVAPSGFEPEPASSGGASPVVPESVPGELGGSLAISAS
jgi:hypothetical protein